MRPLKRRLRTRTTRGSEEAEKCPRKGNSRLRGSPRGHRPKIVRVTTVTTSVAGRPLSRAPVVRRVVAGRDYPLPEPRSVEKLLMDPVMQPSVPPISRTGAPVLLRLVGPRTGTPVGAPKGWNRPVTGSGTESGWSEGEESLPLLTPLKISRQRPYCSRPIRSSIVSGTGPGRDRARHRHRRAHLPTELVNIATQTLWAYRVSQLGH